MQVSGIDHVTIITDDLEGSAAFYETLLGLSRSDNPGVSRASHGAWMRDASGHPIVHLVWKDRAAGGYEEYEPGRPTNALHHVALRCQGFEELCRKLDAMGVGYRVNDIRARAGVRQIFLVDPNAVNLELNFAGE